MNRHILILLLQFLSFSCVKAQGFLEPPQPPALILSERDEEQRPYESNYIPSILSFRKSVLSEINMAAPGNRVLDSVLYRRMRPTSFSDIVFDMLRKGKVRAYASVTDTVAILVTNVRKILDSAGYISSEKIIVSEHWLFDNNRSLITVKLVWFAFVAKADDKTYKPVFWILYPYIRDNLKKYKVVVDKENKLRLNVFFEGRFFKSNLIGEISQAEGSGLRYNSY